MKGSRMRRQLVMVGTLVSVGMGATGCRSVLPSEATPLPVALATERRPARLLNAEQVEELLRDPSFPRPPTVAAHQRTAPPPQPCEKLGYYEKDWPATTLPRIQFCNNTPEPLVVRRLDVEGLKEITVLPDHLAVIGNGGPVMGSIKQAELRAGPGLLFGVFAEDGTPRGRILYLPEPLLAPIQPNWTCLSMASEPPFVMRHGSDFPKFCP